MSRKLFALAILLSSAIVVAIVSMSAANAYRVCCVFGKCWPC